MMMALPRWKNRNGGGYLSTLLVWMTCCLGLLLLALLLPTAEAAATLRAANTNDEQTAALDNPDANDAIHDAQHRSLQSKCQDMTTTTFTDKYNNKRDCKWLAARIKQDEMVAMNEYCIQKEGYRLPLAAVICPVTCGQPCPALATKCQDTSAIVGRVALKKKKKCQWIRKREKRLAKYCSTTEGIRSRGDAACPKTCGKCGQVIVGATTTTAKPTRAPTPKPPTAKPTRAPTAGDPCAERGNPNLQSCQVSTALRCATPDGTPCDQLVSTMKCKQTPSRIRFRFTGLQCYLGNNDQDRDFECGSAFSGTDGLKSSKITALGTGDSGSPHLYLFKNIQIGDEFDVWGFSALPDTPRGELRKLLTIILQDGEGKIRQSMKIQMDCSRYDLAYGNRFGALDVLRYDNDLQGQVPTNVKIEYEYSVSNKGQQKFKINDLDTTRHGSSESLVFDLGLQNPQKSINNIGVCDEVKVVKAERINLAQRNSYSANLSVKAENSASLPCGGSASFSFTAGDN